MMERRRGGVVRRRGGRGGASVGSVSAGNCLGEMASEDREVGYLYTDAEGRSILPTCSNKNLLGQDGIAIVKVVTFCVD